MRTAAISALLLLASEAFAQKTAGGESFESLLLDGSARALALGGAYTSMAAGADAVRYNPAGLALSRSYEASAMHDQYFQGATHEHLALAAPAGWGASIHFLNFGGITRTTLSSHAGAGGSVGLSDTALTASYGRTVLDSNDFGSASVGVGLKYLHESIDNIGGNGVAGDAGVLWSHPAAPGLTLGLAALNFGPQVSFQTKRERLPLDLHAGLAFAFTAPGLDNTVSVETMKVGADKADVAAGFETVVRKLIAFRIGYTSRNSLQTGVTGGVGFLWKAWAVDYAAAGFGELGLTNTVSLTYHWGAPDKEKPAAGAQNNFIDTLLPRLSSKRKAAAEAEASGPARPKMDALSGAPLDVTALPSAASDREEHFALAQRFIEDRAYAQAQKELTTAAPLAADERALTIYFERLGIVALDENDMEKARALANALAGALGLRSGPADPYAGAGFCMLVQKDPAYAAKFFQKALEMDPSPKTRRWVEARLAELRAARP